MNKIDALLEKHKKEKKDKEKERIISFITKLPILLIATIYLPVYLFQQIFVFYEKIYKGKSLV